MKRGQPFRHSIGSTWLTPSQVGIVGVSLLSLLVGSIIYLLFRDVRLRIFYWLDILNLKGPILDLRAWVKHPLDPHPFIFGSLPGGLWLLSGTLIMKVVWWNENGWQVQFWILILATVALVSEFGQLLWVPGTFDIHDVVAYLIGAILAIFACRPLEVKK
jgi:hypothetical protein